MELYDCTSLYHFQVDSIVNSKIANKNMFVKTLEFDNLS